MEGKIIMSQKEFNRMNILTKVLECKLKQVDAANILNLSTRHINRIIQNARVFSLDIALIHKNRGQASSKKIKKEFKEQIISLYRDYYYDFKPTFFCEKLEEIHDIKTNKETVRNILTEYGLWHPKKRKFKKAHIWRERKHHFGELIQMDGSFEYWLENRFEKAFCLMSCIDDATGQVFMRFYDYEGTFPALDFTKRFIQKFGLPKAFYLDKHSTYKTTRQPNIEEQLKNAYPETQFQRVMHSLDIETLTAHSPQAKGRIERLFSTLQDRLIKELRIANICNIAVANKFLENFMIKYNQKFSVQAKSKVSLFRKLSQNFDYKWTFTIQDKRTILNDHTIRWNNRLFLIQKPAFSQRKQNVFIKMALDGSLQFFYKNKIIDVKEITHKNIQIVRENKKLYKKLNILINKNLDKNSIMDKLYLSNFSIFNF